MLIHPWDESASTDEWVGFVRAQGFGHLVAGGRDREAPVVVPTQFSLPSPSAVLLHLARPNPIWRAIEENPTVVLSVAGDWAYIPAAWKAIGDEDPSTTPIAPRSRTGWRSARARATRPRPATWPAAARADRRFAYC